MVYKELKECKICGYKSDSNIGITTHIKLKHNLTIRQYVTTYLDLPICPYCNQEKVDTYINVLNGAKRNNGRLWKLTCSKQQCKSKHNIQTQKKYYENNEAARQLHRKHRVEYLKQRTGKTAWERRAAGEMSYLEQWFFDNVIIKYDLAQKYDIINQLSVYPYFIDFAFQNINVAVQLDGKCHFVNGESRNGHDKKKDQFLIDNGWKVFRIGYTENNEETIQEFLQYISDIEAGEKVLDKRVFKYSEYKLISKNKKERKLSQWQKEEKIRRYELNKPLIQLVKSSDIDFSKFGWVNQVAILINKKPQKINTWMKRYMPDFYQEKCFKRKKWQPPEDSNFQPLEPNSSALNN